MQHVAKMGFQAPPALIKKSAAEAAEWVENIKEKYGKALLTMEGAKAKVQQMDKFMQDRAQQGNPFNEEEMKNYQQRKEMQLKMYNDAHKWADGLRKAQQAQAQQQQGNVQPAGQNGAAPAAAAGDASQTGAGASNTQAGTQNATAVNAAAEAAKNMAAQNRTASANGTPTPQQQARPVPNAQQNQAQNQQQRQMGKPEQPQPAPINTALAAAAGQQATATPTQVGAARVQTPQSQTPVAGAGPTRALSHSAAMSLANQRANNTPGSQAGATQQGSGSGTPVSGVVNQNVMGSGAQTQGGHPHAHPSQQQATIQSKLPIPKQLPEKATALPAGVSVGGGVNTGRPTMSQSSGTLGGVMNQPAVPKVPAYSHEAEGDHVLSKKKLDELVRQVCGGSAEGQDANLLTPDVEEVRKHIAIISID